METEKKKQFIAGAKCPNCHQLDGIRLWKQQGMYFKDCYFCDFKEALSEPENNHLKQIAIKQVK